MQGYQYRKSDGHFVVDVPHWDGNQPGDLEFGITGIPPGGGRVIHKFDGQTWIEGATQTELDAIAAQAEATKQLQAEAAADSPPMQAAINVFTQIILAGEKPDAATVRQRVVNEIKTKL